MLPAKMKKSEFVAQHHSLRSRLTAPFMGKNSENGLPGLENKSHLRLLEVTSHDGSSRVLQLQAKRKTRTSPQGPAVKRTAFSDVTNAIQRLQLPLSNNTNKVEKGKKIATGRTTRKVAAKQPPVIQEEVTEEENATLYESALEDVSESSLQTQSQPEAPVVEILSCAPPRSSSEPPSTRSEHGITLIVTAPSQDASVSSHTYPCTSLSDVTSPAAAWHMPSPDSPPPGVNNFDKDSQGDVWAVPEYAPYIFSYLKSRESHYQVRYNFLDQHEHLNKDVRSICVDWMIEVQETLELNHETLYLGVKNMDLFLSNPKASTPRHPTPALPIRPSRLRLLACASLLLAAQYDERMPPPSEDWLQMCDRDYTATELHTMQQQLFVALGFDLGAPLSYRFLRRFARACSIEMDLLTLARYILESSLLDAQFSPESDSKLAAAALWLALCMHAQARTPEARAQLWTTSLHHYTGYATDELQGLASRLNSWISAQPIRHLRTVYSKYSHRVFRKVALIPALKEM